MLPPMENVYQSERERDRKEHILKKSINYFDKGKVRLTVLYYLYYRQYSFVLYFTVFIS